MYRIQKKEEILKNAYLQLDKVQGELPIIEYYQFLMLKKDYNLPLTDEQKSFLQTIESNI